MESRFQPVVIRTQWSTTPPYNTLVLDPAVTNSSVPHRMPSECLPLRLIPPGSKRGFCRNSRQPVDCYNCGTAHSQLIQCPAADRKCYQCHYYGHYAAVCKNNQPSQRVNNSPSADSVKSTDSVQVSSVSTHAASSRDTDLIQKLQSKCNILEAQSSKLQEEKVVLESECCNLKSKCEKLSENMSQLEQKLSRFQVESVVHKKEHSSLQEHNKRLKDQVTELQKSRSEAEKKSSKSENENVVLKSECENLKVQNKELSDKVRQLKQQSSKFQVEDKVNKKDKIGKLQAKLRGAECHIDQLESDLKHLLGYSAHLNSCNLEANHLLIHYRQELEAISQRIRHPGNSNLDPCKKCGTFLHVKEVQCPAILWTCYNCKLYGHFASVCQENSSLLAHEPVGDTAELLNNLGHTTGIWFKNNISCTRCDALKQSQNQ